MISEWKNNQSPQIISKNNSPSNLSSGKSRCRSFGSQDSGLDSRWKTNVSVRDVRFAGKREPCFSTPPDGTRLINNLLCDTVSLINESILDRELIKQRNKRFARCINYVTVLTRDNAAAAHNECKTAH